MSSATSSPQLFVHGARGLRALLERNRFDVRSASPESFGGWLRAQHDYWMRNQAFVLRCQIRDLVRADPGLRALLKAHAQAVQQDAESPYYGALEAVSRDVLGAEKAIQGLSAAYAPARGTKRAALQEKLEEKKRLLASLLKTQSSLTAQSPERQALQKISVQLERAREATGMLELERALEGALSAQGQRAGTLGSGFEKKALAITRRWILPRLTRDPAPLKILTNLRVGDGRTELDQLVIRPRAGAAQVLAVVEVKRNLADLGRGFAQRQENLAWLTGDHTGYEAEQHRTHVFPSGRFDRAVEHQVGTARYQLTERSFSLFRRTEGRFLRRLFFICKVGPLFGMSSAVLSRLQFRVATDIHFELEDPVYLAGLLEWVQALADPMEAPEVLALYARTPQCAKNVLIVSGAGPGSG